MSPRGIASLRWSELEDFFNGPTPEVAEAGASESVVVGESHGHQSLGVSSIGSSTAGQLCYPGPSSVVVLANFSFLFWVWDSCCSSGGVWYDLNVSPFLSGRRGASSILEDLRFTWTLYLLLLCGVDFHP